MFNIAGPENKNAFLFSFCSLFVGFLLCFRTALKQSKEENEYIEQTPGKVLLIPANSKMTAMTNRLEQVEIQGVIVGQMRSYRSFLTK